MANPIKSLIGQTAVYGLSSIAGRFLNYLLVPFYTSLFVANEYGIVTELYAYVSILLIILTYGMETGYFRFCQNSNYKKTTVYSTSVTSLLITSVLFIVLIYFQSDYLAYLLGYKNNSSYVLLLGLTVGLDAITAIPFAKLRIENRAKLFAIIKFLNIGLNIGLNLFFFLFVPNFLDSDNFFYTHFYEGLDVGYIFLANFIASLSTFIILLPEYLKAFKPYVFDKKLFKSILNYSYPLLFAGIAGMMSENLDRILLKYYTIIPEFIISLSTKVSYLPSTIIYENNYIMHQVGIYGANVKIAVLMTLFIQAFRYAAEPFFFNYSKKEDSKVLYAKVMRYFIVFCLTIFLGVTLFIDLVKFIINSNYHEGLFIVPIMLISKMFFGIIFNLSIWYKLTNKTIYGAILAFLGAITSIVLNIILIPKYGYLGCAWASLSAYTLMMLVSFLLLRKHFPITYDLKRIGIYLISALIIFFVNIYLRTLTEYYLLFNVLLIGIFALIVYKSEHLSLQLIKRSLKIK